MVKIEVVLHNFSEVMGPVKHVARCMGSSAVPYSNLCHLEKILAEKVIYSRNFRCCFC